MNEAVREIEVDAPPSAVWALLEDVRRMPELSPSTTSVVAPPRLRSVGDQFEQVVRFAGRSLPSTWTVTDIDPGRRLVVTGSVLPGTHYEMHEEIEPVDGKTRVRLRMRWSLPFGPIGRLANRLGAAQRAVSEAETVLAGIRRVVEGGREIAVGGER